MTDRVLIALVTACFLLQPISTDLYLASLPALVNEFEAPLALVQLTLSLFAMAFGFAQLLVGPLSDRLGRRPLLIAGAATYVFGSLGCAFSQSLASLIFFRVLQAVGCCTAVVVSRAVVRDCHSLTEAAQRIAKASSNMGGAVLLGPIVGAQLQIHFGWRAAFVFHAVVGLALLVFIHRYQVETVRNANSKIMTANSVIGDYLLVAKRREFWAYALPGCLSYGALFVFISGASFSLIRVLGVSVATYGYCFSLGCTGYLLGSLLCRIPFHTIHNA